MEGVDEADGGFGGREIVAELAVVDAEAVE